MCCRERRCHCANAIRPRRLAALLIVGNIGEELCVALRQKNRNGTAALEFDAQSFVGSVVAAAVQCSEAPFLVRRAAPLDERV